MAHMMIWSSLALNRSLWPVSRRSLGFIPVPACESDVNAHKDADKLCKKIDRERPQSCKTTPRKPPKTSTISAGYE
jgi:hypothetical protein